MYHLTYGAVPARVAKPPLTTKLFSTAYLNSVPQREQNVNPLDHRACRNHLQGRKYILCIPTPPSYEDSRYSPYVDHGRSSHCIAVQPAPSGDSTHPSSSLDR